MLPFFFKKLCFQKPLSCYSNDLIILTVIVRKCFGHLQTVLGGLSQPIIRETVGQKIFFTGAIAFCFSKICVFNNLIVRTATNLQIAQ